MRIKATTMEHKTFRDDVLDLLKKHSGHLPADEMLALASQLVGSILALQDQKTMNVNGGIELILANIERGNQQVVECLSKPSGSA